MADKRYKKKGSSAGAPGCPGCPLVWEIVIGRGGRHSAPVAGGGGRAFVVGQSGDETGATAAPDVEPPGGEIDPGDAPLVVETLEASEEDLAAIRPSGTGAPEEGTSARPRVRVVVATGRDAVLPRFSGESVLEMHRRLRAACDGLGRPYALHLDSEI